MIPTNTTEWLSLLGNKWALPVLRELNGSKGRRFGQLKSSIAGVSQRMLAQTLRELVEAGIVARLEVSKIPICVEYSVTTFGTTLAVPLEAFEAWAKEASIGARQETTNVSEAV